jgi:excisionase family DNA binding protein
MTTAPVASWDQLPPFLTAVEVATFLRVNHKTVRAAEKRGLLRAVRLGTRVRFHRDEVRRFVESGGLPPAASVRKR